MYIAIEMMVVFLSLILVSTFVCHVHLVSCLFSYLLADRMYFIWSNTSVLFLYWLYYKKHLQSYTQPRYTKYYSKSQLIWL